MPATLRRDLSRLDLSFALFFLSVLWLVRAMFFAVMFWFFITGQDRWACYAFGLLLAALPGKLERAFAGALLTWLVTRP